MKTDAPTRVRSRMLFQPTERLRLDPHSPVPLYHQVEQTIIKRIERAGSVGRMLPREMDLVEIFDVSRATIKRATDSLVSKGLIERKRAVGTRVISSTIIEDLGKLRSSSELMRDAGLTVRTTVLATRLGPPTEDAAKQLKLEPEQRVLHIERLRGTTKVFPIVLLHSQIPEQFQIPVDADFSRSLYDLLERDYRIPLEWAEETISAVQADEREARLLGLKPKDTVLRMERLTFTRGDIPVEHVRAVYNPEHYTFSIRLRR